MIAVMDFESFYRQHLPDLKGSGENRTARCLFHDDKTASLSVNVQTGTWKCHAGGCGKSGNVNHFAMLRGLQPPPAGAGSIGPKEIAVYDYKNEKGLLLYQVVRMRDDSNPKGRTFKVRTPDGKWGLNGARKVLYRLPEIKAKPDPVLFVAGEKDVDTAVMMGMNATCNVFGAGKWSDDYSEVLKGRTCVVIPDNDEPGIEHAQAVVRSLKRFEIPVRMLTLPKGKDVTEWRSLGGNTELLENLLLKHKEKNPLDANGIDDYALRLRNIPKVPSLVGDGLIVRKSFTILHGPEGVGKSWLVMQLAKCVAYGIPWMGLEVQKGRVLYIGTEMNEWVVKARSAQIDSLLAGPEEEPLPGTDDIVWWIAPFLKGRVILTDDFQTGDLAQYVEDRKFDLVIIDPLSDFHDLEENSNTDMGKLARGISRLCEVGTTVVAVHHDRKLAQGIEEDNTRGRMRGASKLRTSATSVFTIHEKHGRMVLDVTKSNFCAPPESIYLTEQEGGGYKMGTSPSEQKQERKGRVDQVAMAIIRAGSAGISKHDLLDHDDLKHMKERTIQLYLHQLVEDQKVKREGINRGIKYYAYCAQISNAGKEL